MDRWRNGQLHSPISLMADIQTSGRGRRGREWESESGHSLTFSIAYPFTRPGGVAQLSGLSLMCGLTLIHGLSQYFEIPLSTLKASGLGLKWPNDVLVQQKKLAGILIEGGQSSPESPSWMIIGIGINLHPLKTKEIAQSAFKAGSLEDLLTPNAEIDALELWKIISKTYIKQLSKFNEEGFKAFVDEWNQWNAFQDQYVFLRQDQQTLAEGQCFGINEDGALLIKTHEGLQTIHNGDLSLRLNDE